MRYILIVVFLLFFAQVGHGEVFESRYEHIREHIKSNSSGNDLFTDWIALNTIIIEDLEQQLAELKAEMAELRKIVVPTRIKGQNCWWCMLKRECKENKKSVKSKIEAFCVSWSCQCGCQ